ncbi:MAG TPA: hypothetical protein VEA17_09740 [Bordetella sp.]|nr:hypothetical protein [Bordetella sp.]
MSEILNLKHMLPERLHGRYITDDQIKRALRSRDADTDTLAHVLVSERHGKFDLVHLVAYLLRERTMQKAGDGGALHRLVDEKFTSGNAIPVERITITRTEYDAALAAQKAGGGDAKDAARYRWLRNRSHFAVSTGWIGCMQVHCRDGGFRDTAEVQTAVDTAIDAAMQQQSQEGK